jgi:hypothetical protein
MRYIASVHDTVTAGRENENQAKLTGTWYASASAPLTCWS